MSDRRAPKDGFEPRVMPTDPNNVWAPELFSRMIDRFCKFEVTEAGPLDADGHIRLRFMIEQNINAHAIPAGNA